MIVCTHEFRPQERFEDYCMCGSHKSHHVVLSPAQPVGEPDDFQHLLIQEELAKDERIINETVSHGGYFQDWRLASLAAKKGHRALMVTTAGDFVVLTDRQELALREAPKPAPQATEDDPCMMTDAQYEEYIYGPNRAKWPTTKPSPQAEPDTQNSYTAAEVQAMTVRCDDAGRLARQLMASKAHYEQKIADRFDQLCDMSTRALLAEDRFDKAEGQIGLLRVEKSELEQKIASLEAEKQDAVDAFAVRDQQVIRLEQKIADMERRK